MVLVQKEIKRITMRPEINDMQWPCPTGFHVPKYNEFVNLHNIWVNIGAWANDWIWEKELLKIPLAWYRDAWNSATYSQWGDGIYRCSEAYSTQARRIGYSSWWIVLNYISWRWAGISIRPFKDTPVVPDSWWTTLYAWTWDAWIFHDSGNGLISLSSDGVNWITIADKNLWATTVWNNWDTLNQNNCWYYYQRWNNYGFPRTWSVTTSWTQVDASNYWPWNYYSNSTFITWNVSPYDWSSVQNDNLRWWVTQSVTQVEKQIRPVVQPWYQPNEHTILYCPYTENANDNSLTPRSITVNTLSSYTTFSEQNGMYINKSGTENWLRIIYGNYTTTSQYYTMSVWIKMTEFHKDSHIVSNQWWLAYITDFNAFRFESKWSSTKSCRSTSTIQLNTWYNVIWVRDWSSIKLYLNWTQEWTNSISWTWYIHAELIWPGWDATSVDRCPRWYIKDLIYEDQAWSAQEVSDYYNLTKWNYWL
mgnify:CR=1 FL=1